MEKSYSQTKEQALASRNWVVVDASDKVFGRLASEIAEILRGKNKVTYTPHVDGGDFVVVINASKLKVTGKKGERTEHFFHSGWIGGGKSVALGELLANKPEKTLMRAVKRMLPAGVLGRQMLTKLKIYSGESHPHMAQKPTVLSFN